MTTTASPLPTAWLAPPPGLLATNQAVKITPVPIAISATIALIIGALVVLLFSRKHKDVFLEDKPIPIPHHEETTAQAQQGPLHISAPVKVRIPDSVHHALSHTKSPIYQQPYRLPPSIPRTHQSQTQVPDWAPSGQKLDAMLGMNRDWEYDGYTTPRRTSPVAYYESRHARDALRHAAYDSDDETLKDDERNSAYVPFNGSEVDYGKGGRGWGIVGGGLSSSHIEDDGSVEDSVEAHGRRQRAFDRRFGLGDAY